MLTELSSAFQERPNVGPLYLQQSIEQRILYATLYNLFGLPKNH